MYILYKLILLKNWVFRSRIGETIIKGRFRYVHGRELNLNTPRTFTEKLFCRMVLLERHGNPVFTRLADKYLARDYVREKIGEKYLVKQLWHGTDPSLIPFAKLPAKCVIKTTHGSSWNIILNERSDHKEVVNTLRKWLKENYYWVQREYHYYPIKPRILIQDFLDDGYQDGPLDYRFWCFSGQPEAIQVGNNSPSGHIFFDTEWNELPLRYNDRFEDFAIEKPDNLNEMVQVAKSLSAGFAFVRVDLFNIKGKVYFGELTFVPAAGYIKFITDDWDVVLGDKWVGGIG